MLANVFFYDSFSILSFCLFVPHNNILPHLKSRKHKALRTQASYKPLTIHNVKNTKLLVQKNQLIIVNININTSKDLYSIYIYIYRMRPPVLWVILSKWICVCMGLFTCFFSIYFCWVLFWQIRIGLCDCQSMCPYQFVLAEYLCARFVNSPYQSVNRIDTTHLDCISHHRLFSVVYYR